MQLQENEKKAKLGGQFKTSYDFDSVNIQQ